MRACPVCGSANGESDDFCGNCGSYLGWSQEGAGEDGAGAGGGGGGGAGAGGGGSSGAGGGTGVAGAGEGSGAGGVSRAGGASRSTGVSGAAGNSGAGGDSGAAGNSGAGAGDGAGAARADGSGVAGAEGPSPDSTSSATRRSTEPGIPASRPSSPVPPSTPPPPARPQAAAPPTVPGPRTPPPAARDPRAGAAPAAPGAAADPELIGAVRPAKPVAARPVVRQSAVREPDSGVPCPSCGTLNQPGRRFCRRCAARLDAPEPVAALPWWRTRWPLKRRVRIGGSGRWRRRILALLVVVALVVAGFLLLPAGRFVLEDVRDKLGDASAISPAKATASATVPGHPAGDAMDGTTNRYWGAPSLGASVTFTFKQPFRLVDVVVFTGPSKEPEGFRREARPTAVDLVVTSKDGTEQTRHVQLNDKPGQQTIATGISDVVRVRLVLREAAGLSSGRHLAVGEVEFYQRS